MEAVLPTGDSTTAVFGKSEELKPL